MTAGPKIFIAGCGAVGSAFGCLLGEAGHNVTLLGRHWHLDAIRSGGLRMDGIWGNHSAENFHLATETGDLSGLCDLLIIATKSYDTETILREVQPFLKAGGLALSLQNGLGNIEALGRVFGPERSLGASVLVGMKLPDAGRVTVTVQAAPIVMGPLELSGWNRPKVEYWCRTFNQANIPCETTSQILSCLWAKVFYNAPLNAVGALLEVHYGALTEEPEIRTIMDSIIEETFSVAKKKRVELPWNTADEYRRFFYSHLVPATYNHHSSMLQDLQRGRRTEIDAINGQIWRYGEDLNIATPFNEVVTRLIWQREKRSGLTEPSPRKQNGLHR